MSRKACRGTRAWWVVALLLGACSSVADQPVRLTPPVAAPLAHTDLRWLNRVTFGIDRPTTLRRDQTDLQAGLLHVTRLKRGVPSTHPLRGPELRALRQIQRDYPASAYVFTTERGGPLTGSAVRKIIARAGRVAKLGFSAHPHMLRHATGYYLANNGEDTRSIQHYLGHRNIQHTVRYTDLAPDRFKGFWKD